MTSYSIDHVRVQVYAAPVDAFVLGYGVLGTTRLGTRAGGKAWRDLTCDATSITWHRGGAVDGATTSLDTGILTLTLKNAGDPASDPGSLPGTRIRVRTVTGGVATLFTGTVEDVATIWQKDGVRLTTLSSSDAVRVLANTPRHGAVSAGGARLDTWGRRMNSLAAGTGIPRVAWDTTGPALVVDRTAESPTTFGTWSRWGTPPASPRTNNEQFERDGNNRRRVRFELNLGNLNGNGVVYSALASGIQTTLTGLEPGAIYAATVDLLALYGAAGNGDHDLRTYRAGIDEGGGTTWGDPVQLPPNQFDSHPDYPQLPVTWRAGSSSATLKVARDFTGVVGRDDGLGPFPAELIMVYGWRVWKITPAGAEMLPLQDVNYETSTLRHMQMACDSVGAAFWIDTEGRIVTRTPGTTPPAPVLHASDVHDPADPLHACYVGIDMSFDTREIVNALDVDNHGRRHDPDKIGNWLVDDTLHSFEDAGSVATYNPRYGKITTCLPAWAIPERAATVLAATTRPSSRVNTVTFDAVNEPRAARIDLHQTIRVTFRGATSLYRVVGIDARITPTQWLHTLTLRKDG